MDADRWQRIDDLFHRALSVPATERTALLDALCADDVDLRTRVDALLRSHEREVPILDGGREAILGVLDEPAPSWPAERRIGGYDIVRELGRGGMGIVYLAERADADFHQLVALKCLLPGVATEALAARFRRERRILATLNHPAIAQLHDGGVSSTGAPYLVMEYVDGEPLDQYCDRLQLDVQARLQLFSRVCDAVQYAHQHLVVHRDLKPGNVLVTRDGHVKLLDFGIATLLADDGVPAGSTTQTVRALTPVYASPEQLRGDAVTTASDVFSLGLILYELLTGRRALATSGPRDLVRAMTETAPLRASEAVQRAAARSADATGEDEAHAAARGTTPERLARRLRGDVDTIIATAVRHEPSERYASVQLMLDDVRRHLDGLPIRARAASRVYRARKFVRRHAAAVTAAAAVTLALVAGLGATVWQRAIAEEERDVARAEAAKAQRVVDFLVSIFAAADPQQARGDTLTAHDILERGERQVEAELASEPAVRATVERAIGQVYGNLAEFERARSLLERSLATHRRELGADHLEVAADLHALAQIGANVGLPPDSLFSAALAIRRRRLAPDDPLIASTLHGLGSSYVGSANDAAADTLLQQALAIFERHEGHEASAGGVLTTLGLLNHSRGAYDEAERRYRQALAVLRAAVGEEHPSTLTALSNLGWLLQVAGRLEAADSVLRRTLEVRRRVLGERHTLVAATLHGLGEVAYRRGAHAEAEAHLMEALAIRRERWSSETPSIADNLQMIASVLAASGRTDEAHARYDEAIALLERDDRTGSNTMARAINNRAGLYRASGDFAGAADAYRNAWAIYRENLGSAHPFAVIVQGNVGSMLLMQDSLDTAEPLLRDALAGLEQSYGADHRTVGNVLADVGLLELRTGRTTEAASALQRAVTILAADLPAGHPSIAVAELRLGQALTTLGRTTEAEPLLLSALATFTRVRAQRARDYDDALTALEELYDKLGRAAEARRFRDLRTDAS